MNEPSEAIFNNAEIENRIRDMMPVSDVLSIANGKYAAVEVVQGDLRVTVYIKGLPDTLGGTGEAPVATPSQSEEPEPDLAQELDALKDENAELKAELERLRADAHNFPENLTDKLSH